MGSLNQETLEQRIVRFIAEHPEGVTIKQIAKELGVKWQELIKPVESLEKKGELKKVFAPVYCPIRPQ